MHPSSRLERRNNVNPAVARVHFLRLKHTDIPRRKDCRPRSMRSETHSNRRLLQYLYVFSETVPIIYFYYPFRLYVIYSFIFFYILVGFEQSPARSDAPVSLSSVSWIIEFSITVVVVYIVIVHDTVGRKDIYFPSHWTVCSGKNIQTTLVMLFFFFWSRHLPKLVD